ncbi:MAG: AmmeMemoRadiSam system protein B [Myxococcales bacterium]|nr:AmmeMemoRadiSam system protein B [Myxococcales bacterium]
MRPPAVAGAFYPEDPRELTRTIVELLANAAVAEAGAPVPRALIVPHAGYFYSGHVAAVGFARWRSLRGKIKRAVILGPSHRVPLRGVAFPSVSAFRTPLGDMPVDRSVVRMCADLPYFQVRDDAHAFEHSIEVELPFLQVLFGDIAIVPLVLGDVHPTDVRRIVDRLWNDDDTVLVVSSDLSHYLPDGEALQRDAATTAAMETLDGDRLGPEDACGFVGVRAVLELARQRGLHMSTLAVANSGAASGDRSRVVGYGAYGFA